MANEKRYYWLKFREDFFDSKRIKKLRRVAGGDTFTIIYLKMQLKALRSDGYLYYDGLEDTFAEELALDIDEDADNVRMTINYLLNTGLLESSDEATFRLPWVAENTGSETASTQRVREFRKRQKALHENADETQMKQICNADETETKRTGNVEIEIEKDIEIDKEKEIHKEKEKPTKHRYGAFNHVLLTDAEVEKLINDFGFDRYTEAVNFFDEYIEEKGYKSKSHYLAMRRWVFTAVEERNSRKKPAQNLNWLDEMGD